MIGSEVTLQLGFMRLVAGLIMFMVQGLSIAGVAVLLGDKGPRHDGRLSALPFRHIDLLGLASLVVGGFGWGKTVAIDPAHLRAGRWGLVMAVLAGSVALVITGWLLVQLLVPALTMLPHSAALATGAFLRTAARLCVWMAIFSLLPVPPLAGAHFLAAAGYRPPARTGIVIGCVLLVVSLLGVTRTVLQPVYDLVAPLVLGSTIAGV